MRDWVAEEVGNFFEVVDGEGEVRLCAEFQ